MGSLVVKLDAPTQARLREENHYSDVDVLGYKSTNRGDGVEVPMCYDVEAVKVSVRNILMWRVGENILRPEFGHKLQLSMYSQMNAFNQDAICEEIKRAIEDNEPRVQVRSVSVKKDDEDPDSNALHVQVVYMVVGQKTDGVEIVEQTTISGK